MNERERVVARKTVFSMDWTLSVKAFLGKIHDKMFAKDTSEIIVA